MCSNCVIKTFLVVRPNPSVWRSQRRLEGICTPLCGSGTDVRRAMSVALSEAGFAQSEGVRKPKGPRGKMGVVGWG